MGDPIPATVSCPDWCELDAAHEYVRTSASLDPMRVHTRTTAMDELSVVLTQREHLISSTAVAGRPEVSITGALHTADLAELIEVVDAVLASSAVLQPAWPLPPGVRVWDALSRRWGAISADTEVNGKPLDDESVAVELDTVGVIVRAHRGALLRPVNAPAVGVVAAHA